ncbi:MAG: hypothetical protein J6S10_00010, partial [Clostridia bacterium]|nr:hypothetical protein [Clostridia bacterium]
LSGSEESRRAIPLEDDNERETLNHIIPVGTGVLDAPPLFSGHQGETPSSSKTNTKKPLREGLFVSRFIFSLF